jgi:hypothetical protein
VTGWWVLLKERFLCFAYGPRCPIHPDHRMRELTLTKYPDDDCSVCSACHALRGSALPD